MYIPIIIVKKDVSKYNFFENRINDSLNVLKLANFA